MKISADCVIDAYWLDLELFCHALDLFCQPTPVAGCKMEVAVWLAETGTLQIASRPSGLLGPKNMDRSDPNAMAISGMLEIGGNYTPR